MISYGDMLDVVEKEEAKNTPQTLQAPPVETPKEPQKKDGDDDNIEDVIDEEEEELNEN